MAVAEIGHGFLADAACVHGCGARLGDGEQSLLLVLHVALHRFDQVGDFVVTLLEQHVNVAHARSFSLRKRTRPL